MSYKQSGAQRLFFSSSLVLGGRVSEHIFMTYMSSIDTSKLLGKILVKIHFICLDFFLQLFSEYVLLLPLVPGSLSCGT